MQYVSLSASQLAGWALFNNVEMRGIKIEPHVLDEDGNAKGGGLEATAQHSEGEPLLIVPHDIVVSKEQITACARTDLRLRELLEALNESDLIKVGR